MGSGLGTHNDNYMKYINKIASEVQLEMQLNTYDASSLLLRLITETGFLGLILFYGFIIKFSLFRKKPLNNDQFIWLFADINRKRVKWVAWRSSKHHPSLPYYLLCKA